MIKKRILFVDDDPSILAGLQNLLYRERKRWEMVFAPGGSQALAELAKHSFDVVVSDMRMPGVDGAMVLDEVKQHSPSTARIMLSGHAEREAIVRALPALHQLLSKPCAPSTLLSAIERGLELSRELPISSLIGRVDNLPSPPSIYAELTHALEHGDPITPLVARDPALAAKVLQLVNSAYFGAGQQIASLPHALSLLGLERLRYISTMAPVFSVTEGPLPELTIGLLQRRAHACAMLAVELIPGDEVYAAALLADIGRIPLVLGMPEPYAAVLRRAAACHEVLAVAENTLLGIDHADVGGCLLALWGLPASLVDLVRHHTAPDRAQSEQRMQAAAIHVADALVHGERIDAEAIARAGAQDQLTRWLAIADSRTP